MDKNLQILHPDLTLKDEDLNPFWNEQSKEYQSILWQPHKIESVEQDLGSLNVLSNYQEGGSNFWKKTIVPNNLTLKPLLVSSPALLTRIMEKDHREEELELTTSKKIRIYPKDPSKFLLALHLHRRAYNLTIEAFKSDIKPSSELRRTIFNKCKEEYADFINLNLIYEAYRKACTTRSSVISKRIKKHKCDYSFLSWKYSSRYFLVEKLGVLGSIYKNLLGDVYYSESVPKEAIHKNATVSYQNGQWFISVKQLSKISPLRQENSKIVSLDPGIRTFITSYSEYESSKYGNEFSKTKLVPIMLKLNKLLSYKDSLQKKLNEKGTLPQWISDRFLWVEKQINFARAKQTNLVKDLHKRVAYDLIMKYDVILLPSFKVSQMISKTDTKNHKRKIRKITVRSMLSLEHYKFKLTLKWMAKKYGKFVLDVNEAYTSKTLWDGTIKNNLNSLKEINYNNIKVDRDIHGARNIMIRFLTKHI